MEYPREKSYPARLESFSRHLQPFSLHLLSSCHLPGQDDREQNGSLSCRLLRLLFSRQKQHSAEKIGLQPEEKQPFPRSEKQTVLSAPWAPALTVFPKFWNQNVQYLAHYEKVLHLEVADEGVSEAFVAAFPAASALVVHEKPLRWAQKGQAVCLHAWRSWRSWQTS